MKPSVGRWVHYVLRHHPNGEPACTAALITSVVPDGTPFYDQDSAEPWFAFEAVTLYIVPPDGYPFARTIIHDENKDLGTWHWPERVE